MKVLRLLIVPAVLLFSVVMAAPALAHEATLTVSAAPCQGSQICIKLHATVPDQGNGERILTFSLFGVKGSNETDLQNTVTLDLPASNGKEQTVDSTQCFTAVTTVYDFFRVKLTKVTDKQGNPSDLQVVVDDHTFKFDEDHQPAVPVLDKITPCVTQTSPPSPPASPGAATTTNALAGTGGFDFRFPLIGLTVLLAGLALLLVSVSRGRSTTK